MRKKEDKMASKIEERKREGKSYKLVIISPEEGGNELTPGSVTYELNEENGQADSINICVGNGNLVSVNSRSLIAIICSSLNEVCKRQGIKV
jgi:hypothetical protein